MNRPEELIKKIYEEQGQIKDVFFTACGGSLVDLYPGFYFINAESETMHSHWLTAKELIVSPSKFLKKGALVILCSHGGNTNETVNAAKLAKERGAAVITMTHNPNSICAQEDMNPVVYSWEDDTNEKEDHNPFPDRNPADQSVKWMRKIRRQRGSKKYRAGYYAGPFHL